MHFGMFNCREIKTSWPPRDHRSLPSTLLVLQRQGRCWEWNPILPVARNFDFIIIFWKDWRLCSFRSLQTTSFDRFSQFHETAVSCSSGHPGWLKHSRLEICQAVFDTNCGKANAPKWTTRTLDCPELRKEEIVCQCRFKKSKKNEEMKYICIHISTWINICIL